MPNVKEGTLSEVLKDLDKLKTPEEKQAYLDEHLTKKEEQTPQVIGLSEHAGANGLPCL